MAGGYFYDTDNSGYAYVGYGHDGIYAGGNNVGGYFKDSDNTGEAWVANGQRGIWARGSFDGGTFSDPTGTTFWADVARNDGYSIYGTGTKSFVQNHPYDKDEVVAYAALEGDEVGVYTRGSARLVDGEARVTLGDTFHLVADPDIGLTAHLTPRGDPVPLAVESVTPSELVVRGPAGSNAAFDYLVFGLRIGFEELPIVRPKERDAFLPDTTAIQAPYADHPELRTSNALARFTTMRQEMGAPGAPDMTGARALAAAIDANRSEIVSAADAAANAERASLAPPRAGSSQGAAVIRTTPAVATPPSPTWSAAAPTTPAPMPLTILPASAPASAGAVLSLDPSSPGAVRPAVSAFDRGVAGCAIAAPEGTTIPAGSVAAGISGVVFCNVDASFGAVAVGDLLTTSAEAGYAMRTGEEGHGAILGKAMEPLAGGTGTIRVLVSLH